MITRLTINNFKALKEADFTLGKITLLSGANAVGKSTLIQSLLLLKQSFSNGEIKHLKLKSDDYLNLGLGKDVVAIGAGPEESISFELTIDHGQQLKFDFGQAGEKDILPLHRISPTKFEYGKLALFSNGKHFQYLGANRITPKVQYKTSPLFVDELHFLGKEGAFTAHYLAKNQNRTIPNKQLQHPNAKSDTLLDNVSAWLSEITEDVKVTTTYYQELETATLTYGFLTQGAYTDFKPTNVGFGLTYVLPIVTAALMLETGGLLIVENPESHLHPKGQSKLAQLCAKAAAAGIQIILETHSDHILNGLRVAIRKKESIAPEDSTVYFFARDYTSATLEPIVTPVFIDESGRLDSWPEGFFDEWDKQLDLLLD